MPVGVYFHKPREQWVKDKIRNTLKGKKPKNFELLRLKSPFVEGHPSLNTGRTHFKKGQTPWNKGIKWEAMSGENHPQWRGGTYEKDRKIDMQRKFYRNWRSQVLIRDGSACIDCGATENLNADHIMPYSLYPELRYELTNGRTLCVDCHKKTDTYGNKAKLLVREDYQSASI